MPNDLIDAQIKTQGFSCIILSLMSAISASIYCSCWHVFNASEAVINLSWN